MYLPVLQCQTTCNNVILTSGRSRGDQDPLFQFTARPAERENFFQGCLHVPDSQSVCQHSAQLRQFELPLNCGLFQYVCFLVIYRFCYPQGERCRSQLNGDQDINSEPLKPSSSWRDNCSQILYNDVRIQYYYTKLNKKCHC